METFKNAPVMLFRTTAGWEKWLSKNHARPDGIWLKLAKKGAGETSVSYAEAVEGALCYGWIDGQGQGLNDTFYLQKFTPRRPRSVWSKVNVGKVEALIKAGRMQPAGLAQIEAAKKDGRWANAYAGSSTMEVPEDFAAALTKNPKAKEFFDTLNKTNRYSFLWRVHTATKPETRAKRIEKFIDMLAAGQTFH